jgi:hypothetical protein
MKCGGILAIYGVLSKAASGRQQCWLLPLSFGFGWPSSHLATEKFIGPLQTTTVGQRVRAMDGIIISGGGPLVIREAEEDCAMHKRTMLAMLAIAVFCVSRAHAEPGKGTTSRAARTEAQQSVPIERVDAQFQRQVSEVLARPSIYRRLPVQTVSSDPELFTFLVSNPEVVINIWQLMGVTDMQIHRVGETTFVADDKVGTKTRLDYVLLQPGLQVIYADGAYDGTLSRKPLRARCVLVLKSSVDRDASGQSRVTTQMDVFLKVDHFGAAAVAKTLQPLIGRSADHNFRETVNFIGKLSRTASANPTGVGRLAERLTDIRPEVRERFTKVVQTVGERGTSSEVAATRSTTSQPSSATRPSTSRIPHAQLPARATNRN